MDSIFRQPYFIDLQKEYFEQKVILDEWHTSNSYGDVINSIPYPKECLYRMIELLEIMDNAYAYAPGGCEFDNIKMHY